MNTSTDYFTYGFSPCDAREAVGCIRYTSDPTPHYMHNLAQYRQPAVWARVTRAQFHALMNPPAQLEILYAGRSFSNECTGKEMAACLSRDGAVECYLPTPASAERNASLFAAASDLLAACELSLKNAEGQIYQMRAKMEDSVELIALRVWRDALTAAIAKARPDLLTPPLARGGRGRHAPHLSPGEPASMQKPIST